MFGRPQSSPEVTAGSVFRRTHKGSLVEMARVVSVDRDLLGIPHVRYEVTFSYPQHKGFRDARVLSLESFSRRYPERVVA